MPGDVRLPTSLETLAGFVGGETRGDASVRIVAIRSLEAAGPDDLGFVLRPEYLARARRSRAGALLVGRSFARELDRPAILVDDSEMALVALLRGAHPSPAPEPGVHRTAVVGEGCVIAPTASVGPYAVLGMGTTLGEGTVVGAHAVVGRDCVLEDGVVLHPHVVLYDGCVIGVGSVVHAGAVLGSDGFGYVSRGLTHHKIPHVGRVRLEEDVEIGALSSVDRAQTEETVVGAGTRVDNQVQVGHNVRIGRGCLLCGQVGLAGSSRLGDGVVLGGQVGVADHVELGSGVMVGATGAALQSIDEPGAYAGTPAFPLTTWRRSVVAFQKLQDLSKRVRELERLTQAKQEDRS